jgi:hypothetical protein
MRTSGERDPARMRAPSVVWVFMIVHCSAFSGPGCWRMASGMAILPTSCIALARRSISARSSSMPAARPSL